MRQNTFFLIFLGALFLLSACAADDDDNDNDETDDSGGDDDGEDDDDNNNDDDDNDDTYDAGGDDDENTDCQGNHAPELFDVKVIVNGQYTEDAVTLYQDDELVLEFEYADEDCNLDGGIVVIVTSDGEMGADDIILSGMGCSSEEEGEPFRKQLDPMDFAFAESVEIGLMDRCEARSERISIDITAQPPA